MARSECENDFKFYSSKLSGTRPLAATYLNEIEKSHWVTYAFNEAYNQPTYDEVTSNLSEAANNLLGNSVRSSYPLEAFEQYMIKVVELFAARRHEEFRSRASSRQIVENTSTNEEEHEGDLASLYKKLSDMMSLTKSLHIVPCLDGQYMIRFTDISKRPDHAHVWRTVNLIEKECTCRRWQDEQFPCAHAVKAAIHHGMHVTELFDTSQFSAETASRTYYYQFVPIVRSATIAKDTSVRVPDILVSEEELGTRGRKPGPKPKHKRKTATPGSAAAPGVALTQ